MKWVVVAALVCAAGVAQAQDRVAKVGAHPAQPEVLIEFDKRMRMGARVVSDAAGALAGTMTTPAPLRLEAGFITSPDVRADKVRLRCIVRFVSATGERFAPVQDQICFAGNLGNVAGKWTVLETGVTFRPTKADPAGTSGVELRVVEEVSGAENTLMPTYGWEGGTR